MAIKEKYFKQIRKIGILFLTILRKTFKLAEKK
jgi:hypothetical protein